jgi:hypothetical protein
MLLKPFFVRFVFFVVFVFQLCRAERPNTISTKRSYLIGPASSA